MNKYIVLTFMIIALFGANAVVASGDVDNVTADEINSIVINDDNINVSIVNEDTFNADEIENIKRNLIN